MAGTSRLMANKRIGKRKAAFFDIDGTIFRSSLLIEITEEFVNQGVFPRRVSDMYATAYQRWLDRKGSYDDYIMAVVKAFEGNIKGVRSEVFNRLANQVVDFRRNRVYRFTRELVKDLKKRGYYLVAISNSPKDILDPFCKKLGFDKVYGRIYEVGPTGKLTGKTEHLNLITDKAKILKRVVERENLTLRGSVGVGDTDTDIRFLRLVERPICFNPNLSLFKYAKRHGWEIAVERKNLIIRIRPLASGLSFVAGSTSK